MPVDVLIQPFNKELEFEDALAKQLTKHGWEPQILNNPSEADLIRNWAAIIYNNNRGVNQLGEFELTDTEMAQVIEQFNKCKNPYERNKLINGGIVVIKRDNPADINKFGKEVFLKIFDAREISTGQSVYQIVRQPRFETKHPLASTRRGDMMLLINGMPVIHIELKRSGVDVTQAINQIKKYTHEGVFAQGIFSLVQVFVAMTPEKTLYFANPGDEKNFSPSFYFHWADSNNDETFDWKRIAANLLSIPMAHQLVGSYTIADDKDETLKVLRSYQYYATNKICDRVHQISWDDHQHKGGFIWHTTGSGKTMTSFKTAQLISTSNDADKVVFLLDRIELSTQSLDEYRGFAGEKDNVNDTDNTQDLVRLLESNDKEDCLIVTSIQKMSRVNTANNVPESSLAAIGRKRVVFIVDECHRSVFGEMLMSIKNTFPRAVLFGFTGTPVFEDNAHKEITTEVIFGDMLHKYTLAHGIPDENVLGFDLYREDTFNEQEIREAVALRMAGVESVEEIGENKEMRDIYDKWMNEVDILKVEDEAKSLYYSDNHHLAVMNKIVSERPVLSHNGMFHAILATKNIPEAIAYYELFKEHYPEYNVVAIFDDNIDNSEHAAYKEDAILMMLEDYNNKFGTSFQQSTYGRYKKDVAKRLAHKKPYGRLPKDQQIDLLIVVTQMLTGYDSKWVNTLYVDKLMKYVDVIQAFSRTNRLFGPEKPFGIIKYFTRPNRMAKNIEEALALYVDQPLSVFADKLEANLENINKEFHSIEAIFNAEGIQNFSKLPQAEVSKKKFAKEFCSMSKHLEAARMQGFVWDKDTYEFQHSNGWITLKVDLDEETYRILLQRYRELFTGGGGNGGDDDVYQLDAYITETGTGTIDADYINEKFIRYIKYLYTSGADSDMAKATQQELHKVFATLSQRDQRTALTILHDLQTGDLRLSADKTIYDYINDYQRRECDHQVFSLCEATGLDIDKVKALIYGDINENNINEHGRFDDLMNTLDKEKAVVFIKRVLGKEVKKMFILSHTSNVIRRFILSPEDRARIIFAYQNENFVFDYAHPQDVPEQEKPKEKPKSEDDERLDDQTKRKNVQLLVMKDLRGITGMPPSEEVVDAFFKILNIKTLPQYDGIAFDMFKVFDELFARKHPKFNDKHVHSAMLLIRFEVYLKKLYYLLRDEEPQPGPNEDNVYLKSLIRDLSCLRGLRNSQNPKLQRLSSYLQRIISYRNTQEGNGAHFAMYFTEDQLDENIKMYVTMYMYVTGMYLQDLKERYDI